MQFITERLNHVFYFVYARRRWPVNGNGMILRLAQWERKGNIQV